MNNEGPCSLGSIFQENRSCLNTCYNFVEMVFKLQALSARCLITTSLEIVYMHRFSNCRALILTDVQETAAIMSYRHRMIITQLMVMALRSTNTSYCFITARNGLFTAPPIIHHLRNRKCNYILHQYYINLNLTSHNTYNN